MPRFRSFDDIALSYERQGEGDPVLLLHGFASDSHINWVRPGLAAALTEAGFAAVLLDQRGHGASEKPHEVEAYQDGAMVRDAAALLDHLQIERVHLVGYSMGAWAALELSATDDRVRSTVCGGIGDAMLDPGTDREALAAALVAADTTLISDPRARSFRDFADLTGADREALAAIQLAAGERFSRYDEVKVPVLLVCGDQDPLAGSPQPLAHRMPDARSLVVGGTHLNVVNNQEFHEAVVSFLAEAPQP